MIVWFPIDMDTSKILPLDDTTGLSRKTNKLHRRHKMFTSYVCTAEKNAFHTFPRQVNEIYTENVQVEKGIKIKTYKMLTALYTTRNILSTIFKPRGYFCLPV